MEKNKGKNREKSKGKSKGKVVPMDPALRKSRKGRRPPVASEQKKRPAQTTEAVKKRKRPTESIKEHKRGMAIRRSTTLVAGLFFVVVLIYLVQTLFAFMTNPEIPVEMVRMDSVDIPQVIEGIIIRDETVYLAPRDGVIQFAVNSYDRVQPGAMVGSIQDVQTVVGIRDSISQVEEQIMRLQDIRGNLSAADPAIRMINGQIQNMVDQRLSRHINLNMSEAFSLRDSITQNVNIRNQMIVAENLDVGVRADLNIQHQVLMDQLDTNQAPIVIEGGGIMAPITDGFEAVLNFENMYYLTQEQTRQNVDFNQIIPRREVEYGDDVFKIINSNRWYIAAYIPHEMAEDFNVGDMRDIYIEGRRTPLTVRVHHIVPGFQDSFVIFRSTAYMIDFLNTRSIFFRTVDTVQHGLRIANTAITARNYLAIPLDCVHGDEFDEDQQYVIRVIGDEDLRVPIAPVDQDDYFAFVSAGSDFLNVGSLLRERENPSATRMIAEERLVQGVFRVVNGIAVFVPIHLPEYASIGGLYSILDPSFNSGIREHDHIVTDASLVEDGDIVFSGVR